MDRLKCQPRMAPNKEKRLVSNVSPALSQAVHDIRIVYEEVGRATIDKPHVRLGGEQRPFSSFAFAPLSSALLRPRSST